MVVLSKTAPIGEFGELGLGDTLSDLKSDYFIKKNMEREELYVHSYFLRHRYIFFKMYRFSSLREIFGTFFSHQFSPQNVY